MSASNGLLWTLLWALIGLLLTIGGTFIEAFTTSPPWTWAEQGLQTRSLGVTLQIGAVLLTGCLGGRNAGALAQIAYLALGLAGLPFFFQGGSLSYLQQPTFGYLLGFVPGAWLCGFLAFKIRPKLENLTASCLAGLLVIHAAGLLYLIGLFYVGASVPLIEAIGEYSLAPLPGQLVVICAVAIIAFALRQVMFY